MNELTRKDAHPLPRIDVTLDALSDSRLFSTLDLASGYWQDEVEPTDRDKTVFTTSFRLYQFEAWHLGCAMLPVCSKG